MLAHRFGCSSPTPTWQAGWRSSVKLDGRRRRYVDRIHDVGGSLRFAERIAVGDSGHFDTLVVIPL
jgi:hypothetical protein